ncbi:MAG: glycosyltransferase family 39 protein [Endomicrobia bacterium]|nr:glycosyltransferase family 39 protein [Endomicrobiia bacterium]
MKKKQKFLQKPKQNFLVLWLGYILIIVWSIIVLKNYYSNFIPRFNFLIDVDFSFIKFLKVSLFHFTSIFFALVILFAGMAIGSFVINKFSLEILVEEKLLFSIVMGLGILSILTFFIGVAGFLVRNIFLILIIPLCLYGIIFFINQFKCIKFTPLKFYEVIILVFWAYMSFLNMLGSLTPEIFFDSQFYQLGVLNLWLQYKKIFSTTYVTQTFFPYNINMLYLIAMILNNEISAKLVHFFCGLLLCFGIYTFCKKYFSQTLSFIAILIFYSIPMVSIVSWKTAVELGIGIFDFCCFFCIINYWNKKNFIWLMLAGIFCGFSLGSKYISIVFCLLPSLVTIIYMGIIEKEKFFSIFKKIFIFSLISFIVMSPWLIRNLIVTGNPIFPFFYKIIGTVKLLPKTPNLPTDPAYPPFNFVNYFLFLWPLTMGKLQQESMIGVIFLLFLPLIFYYKNTNKNVKFISVYLAISVFLFVVVGKFYVRYFVPTLSLISIFYSYLILENNFSRFFRKLIVLLLLFVVISDFMYTKIILEMTQMPYDYVFGNVSFKEYLSTQRPSYPCPYYPVVDYINTNLNENAKIMFLGETRTTYLKRRSVFHGVADFSPLIETLKKVNDYELLYDEFKKQNITHILLNVPEAKRLAGYDNFYFEPREFKILCEFWNKHLKEIYRDIADIALPERGIYSMKKQAPQWWQQYASDPKNYVYLYEIVPETDQAPHNFFLYKELYSEERWQKLKDTVEEILKSKK